MQKLIYGIFALLILLVVVGFLLPRTHQTQTSVDIDAHPATIFALINDFRRHSEWSPWADTDPNARILYSGETRGDGAIMSWDGTVIGRGSQTITSSEPFARIDITMNPGEQGEARSTFTLVETDGVTRVQRAFEVDHGWNIVGRYFAPILSGVVIREYHDGLQRLKVLAEGLPRADFSDLDVEQLTVEAVDIAYLPTTSDPAPAAVAEALRAAYFEVLQFMGDNALTIAGAPMSITRNFDGGNIRFDAAIPIQGLTEEGPTAAGNVRIGTTYSGPVIRVRHVGSYSNLTRAHRQIAAYLAATGIERNGAAWESYVSDPGNTPEDELETMLFYPVRSD